MCFVVWILLVYLSSFVQEISSSFCYERFNRSEQQKNHQVYYLKKSAVLSSSLTCHNVSLVTDLSLPRYYFHEPQQYQQYLNITNSNVPKLPKGAFTLFDQITRLYLVGIQLETIEEGAFENLTKLEELHLDNNNLAEVTDVFSPLEALESLFVRSNKISRINKKAFLNLLRLKNLYLAHNCLTRFDDGPLKKLTHLATVDLSGNPLGTVPGIKVANLNLSNTSLTRFEAIWLTWKIDELDLSQNRLEVFNFSLLPSSIIVVNLSNNQIRSVTGIFSVINVLNLSGNKFQILENLLFSNSKLLTFLYFSGNEISTIGQNAFVGLRSLLTLRLDHNQIQILPVGVFRDLKSLQELDLSYNKIDNLQFGSLEQLQDLHILNLSNNRLLNLNLHLLPKNLRTLHLDSNQISDLDTRYLLNNLDHLNSLSFDRNPWNCMDLATIVKEISQTSINVSQGRDIDRENVHGIACVVKNLSFAKMSVNSFEDSNIQEVLAKNLEHFVVKNMKNIHPVNSPSGQSTKNTENVGLIVVCIVQLIVVSLLLLVVNLIWVFLRRSVFRVEVAPRLELVTTEV